MTFTNVGQILDDEMIEIISGGDQKDDGKDENIVGMKISRRTIGAILLVISSCVGMAICFMSVDMGTVYYNIAGWSFLGACLVFSYGGIMLIDDESMLKEIK